MQNVSHTALLIKQETQGVKYLVECTKVKGWFCQVSPGGFHSSLTPFYFQQWDFQQS